MMVHPFRFLAGMIALSGLVLQFWLMTKYPNARNIIVTTTKFLSFFTIQTNILIVICMILPVIAPNGRLSHFMSAPSVRTAIASYSAVTGIIYFALLRNIGHDQGLERLADQILHYITPTMMVFDWLVWVPKGRVRWTDPARFMIFPALYGVWTLLHGAVTGWYPYPFFNAARIGSAGIFANFAGLTCVVLAIPFAFLLLDRLLATLQRERA
jgi:hypothetical protein